MRVLFVSHSSPLLEGGIETRSREVAKQLVAQGNQVSYFCAKTQVEEKAYEVRDGIRIIRKKVLPDWLLKKFPFPHYFTLAAANTLMMFYLLLFLRKEKIDCLREEFAPVPISGLLAFVRLKSCRRVAVIHTLSRTFRNWVQYFGLVFGTYGYLMERCLKHGLLKFDHFIVASKCYAAYLESHPQIAGKVTLASNGVSDAFFSSNGRVLERDETTPAKLVTVGRLVKIKGHRYLLEALAVLKDKYPRLKLTILGKGPLQNSLKQLAIRLGIADRVEMVPALSHQQIPAFLESFDILVMPSLHEGFNVVVLEAMACGLPAIVSSIEGFRDVADSTALTFFRSGDVQDLADQLDRMLQNPKILQQRVIQAMQIARQHGWKEIATREIKAFAGENLLNVPAVAME